MNQFSQNIPAIDLIALANGEADELLHLACREWGFFRLSGHSFGEIEQDKLRHTMSSFFSESTEFKRMYLRTADNPWGFYDQELTKNKRDWKEIFDMGLAQSDERYTSVTPWPERPTEFETTMMSWFFDCTEIAHTILSAIVRLLGQPRDLLSGYFKPDHTSFLRLNYYPLCDDPAASDDDYPESGNLGISHHTDAGALTVLLQNEIEGLQVRRQNRWYTIPADREHLIINIGDLVQVWSNNQYQAPVHRVLANSKEERYSAAFFYNPAFDTECRPLTGSVPRYRPVNWGEFRAGRAAGDYANQGTEVQISDYLIKEVP